jgi:NADH-quinone oxidoreductase subunit N
MGALVAALFLTLDIVLAWLRPDLSVLGLFGLDLWGAPTLEHQRFAELHLNKDLFSLFFHLVFLLVAFLAVLASRSYIKREEPHQAEYYALLFLSVVGMMFVAEATDLFVLFLAFELSTLCTFGLVAFRKKDARATEAAAKFFVIGAVSSAIILFGISLVYGVTGFAGTPTTDLWWSRTGGAIHAPMSTAMAAAGAAGYGPTIVIAIVCLVAGFGFKVAVVPFHQWAPDVYEGSPDTITVFLAAGTKKVGILAFFKVFLVGLAGVAGDWIIAIAVLAIITQTVGNILAIPQRSVKRMLAYSSIAQAGYIFTAIVVATVAYDRSLGGYETSGGRWEVATYAVAGGLYHVLTHAIMKGGAFLAVSAASVHVGDRIEDFKGLGRRMPLVAVSLSIFLLSLAGIPPFGGFFSKFVLFSSAVYAATYSPWMVALAVSGVLNSALSLYYYARVIRYMVIEEEAPASLPTPAPLKLAILLALIGIVVTGLAAGPFISVAQDAGRAFLPVP